MVPGRFIDSNGYSIRGSASSTHYLIPPFFCNPVAASPRNLQERFPISEQPGRFFGSLGTFLGRSGTVCRLLSAISNNQSQEISEKKEIRVSLSDKELGGFLGPTETFLTRFGVFRGHFLGASFLETILLSKMGWDGFQERFPPIFFCEFDPYTRKSGSKFGPTAQFFRIFLFSPFPFSFLLDSMELLIQDIVFFQSRSRFFGPGPFFRCRFVVFGGLVANLNFQLQIQGFLVKNRVLAPFYPLLYIYIYI